MRTCRLAGCRAICAVLGPEHTLGESDARARETQLPAHGRRAYVHRSASRSRLASNSAKMCTGFKREHDQARRCGISLLARAPHTCSRKSAPRSCQRHICERRSAHKAPRVVFLERGLAFHGNRLLPREWCKSPGRWKLCALPRIAAVLGRGRKFTENRALARERRMLLPRAGAFTKCAPFSGQSKVLATMASWLEEYRLQRLAACHCRGWLGANGRIPRTRARLWQKPCSGLRTAHTSQRHVPMVKGSDVLEPGHKFVCIRPLVRRIRTFMRTCRLAGCRAICAVLGPEHTLGESDARARETRLPAHSRRAYVHRSASRSRLASNSAKMCTGFEREHDLEEPGPAMRNLAPRSSAAHIFAEISATQLPEAHLWTPKRARRLTINPFLDPANYSTTPKSMGPDAPV